VAGAAKAKQSATASIAVWDVPATAVAGERFTVKVGVKSSSACDLRGCSVVVRNSADTVIGDGRLGDAPWPDTAALYWTELPLPAPATEGVAILTVHFSASALQPPHADASATFSFVVVKAPDHTLTVKVVERDGARPLVGAHLRVGAYRATTNDAGSATLRVCKDNYPLHIWKAGYDAPVAAVNVGSDTAIEVEAVIVPEENVDRAWKG